MDQSLHGIHVLLHHPRLVTRLLKTPQPMNAVAVQKIWDLHTIACEGALQHGATYFSRPSSQQFVALRVDVCCIDCDALVSGSLPHGGLFA
jgi:hypothetical protein